MAVPISSSIDPRRHVFFFQSFDSVAVLVSWQVLLQKGVNPAFIFSPD